MIKLIQRIRGIENVLGISFAPEDEANPTPANLYSNTDNIFTGTITRATSDSSGTYTVSGVGFTPRYIEFIGSVDGTSTIASTGWGNEDVNASMSTTDSSLSSCINLSDGINGWTAAVTTIFNDGFILTWTKAALGKNVTVKYLAIK